MWEAVMEFLKSLYDRRTPRDYHDWHRWSIFLPVRSIDDRFIWDAVWRRKTAFGWEYKKRLETPSEWTTRQY
jgi:hypothetical protein